MSKDELKLTDEEFEATREWLPGDFRRLMRRGSEARFITDAARRTIAMLNDVNKADAMLITFYEQQSRKAELLGEASTTEVLKRENSGLKRRLDEIEAAKEREANGVTRAAAAPALAIHSGGRD